MVSESKIARKTEIVGIQYLRGIAALLVLIVHSDHMLRQAKYFGYSYLGDFANGGNLGVDLFFVISGFIMFHITKGFSREIDSKQFIERRFVRIIPFMWLCIIAVYVLRSAVRGGIDPVPFVRALFLWPVGDLDPNPVWTLRHELFFYLCTYFCLASRRGYMVLAAFLLLPIPIFFLKTSGGFWDNEWIDNFFNVRANTSFAMGVLLGWLYRKQAVWLNPKFGTVVVLASPAILLYFEYLTAPLMAAPTVVDATVAESALTQTSLLGVAAKYFLTSCACGFIVFGSLGCEPGNNLWHRLGLMLGNASYSIYLTHEIVISFVGILFVKLKLLNLASVAGIAAIVLALVFGVFVHYLVEKPLIKILRKWMSVDRPMPSTSSNF